MKNMLMHVDKYYALNSLCFLRFKSISRHSLKCAFISLIVHCTFCYSLFIQYHSIEECRSRSSSCCTKLNGLEIFYSHNVRQQILCNLNSPTGKKKTKWEIKKNVAMLKEHESATGLSIWINDFRYRCRRAADIEKKKKKKNE